MTIHPVGSLPLSLQKSQDLSSDAPREGKKKVMHFQKCNQKSVEERLNQNLDVKLQKRGLKRLQEKGLKV